MSSRNYGQACSVAIFLDQLGSRWALLIIRDLLIGPRRFKDLLEGLPGIGPNLLTARLVELQEAKIIRKERAGGRASVYTLTDRGWELEPVILAMARWSMKFLPATGGSKLDRPDLLVVAFRAAFQPNAARGVCDSYEFRIGDTTFFARIDDGELTTGLGPADHPSLVYTTDADVFREIVNGTLTERQARESGLLEIVGDKTTYRRFLGLFSHSS